MSSRTTLRRNANPPPRGGSAAMKDPVLFAVVQISKVIGSGRYAPGARLVEADFERELGLGRVPVREALRIMAGDGVVELVKNRGARIPVISRKQLMEMLQVQDALLRFALEEMVSNPNLGAHIQRLGEVTRKLRERLQAHDVRGTLRGFIRYQELVVQASGNQYLKDVTRRHYLYHYERYLRDLASIDMLEQAVRAYERATQALVRHDGVCAYQCMRLRNYEFMNDLKEESSTTVKPAGTVRRSSGRKH